MSLATQKLLPIVLESAQSDILDTMSTATSTPSQLTLPAAGEPPTGKVPFESWGRYPTYDAKVVPLHWQSDFPALVAGMHNGALPVGMGRSYGDVCLLKDGNLLLTTGMDRLISFDPETGLLTAEAGVTLAQILDFAVPRGFFLPVSPGTKYVTLGGAIANDIHGKNHHVAGTFGRHITQLELVRSDDTRRLCSPAQNADLYAATIGGLGLTGLITWATLRLKPIVSRMIDYEGIQFHGIDEFLDLTSQSKDIEYTVSWVDCTSTGRNFARGVFMQGDHSPRRDDLKPSPKPRLVFPFDAPGFALNPLSVSLFNTAYFHKQIHKRVVSLQDYEPFFYPLDKVLRWNRMYGKRGLLQFQYVIPWEHAKEGTIAILHEVAKSGLASFLAVLKVFGDVPSPGMMSFPKPGITLALDFPIKPDKSFPLFARLADMTLEFGGRLYPAKDAAMTASQFQSFYPQWEQFARYRDPMFTSSFWERVTGDRPSL
jgi:FAD/FMN-containing dehydrogenase